MKALVMSISGTDKSAQKVRTSACVSCANPNRLSGSLGNSSNHSLPLAERAASPTVDETNIMASNLCRVLFQSAVPAALSIHLRLAHARQHQLVRAESGHRRAAAAGLVASAPTSVSFHNCWRECSMVFFQERLIRTSRSWHLW